VITKVLACARDVDLDAIVPMILLSFSSACPGAKKRKNSS
jgi:hypothetical protein